MIGEDCDCIGQTLRKGLEPSGAAPVCLEALQASVPNIGNAFWAVRLT